MTSPWGQEFINFSTIYRGQVASRQKTADQKGLPLPPPFPTLRSVFRVFIVRFT